MRLAKKIKARIFQLEAELKIERDKFFKLRLYKLLGTSNIRLSDLNVSNLSIVVDPERWVIAYDHSTKLYDENNYNHADDSDTEVELRDKTTHISFGYDNKLFLIGKNIRVSRFKLYRNSRKELRIINNDYSFELDTDDQKKLISAYRKNKHIPEWLALNVFLYMCEHQWESNNIIRYLGTV